MREAVETVVDIIYIVSFKNIEIHSTETIVVIKDGSDLIQPSNKKKFKFCYCKNKWTFLLVFKNVPSKKKIKFKYLYDFDTILKEKFCFSTFFSAFFPTSFLTVFCQ